MFTGPRFRGPVATVPGQRPSQPADVLVGRSKECADLGRLVGDPETRLLTLTGPAGVGKTRIATTAADTVAKEQDFTLCWTSVTSVTSEAALMRALLLSAGIRETADVDALSALIERFGGSRVLLVLDDCDHLLDECALVGRTLITLCPALVVLATSREIFRVPGEIVYHVGPLPLPGGDEPAVALERNPAVRLFLARSPALKGRPVRVLRTVATICRQLEGIPLAIELTAARSPLISLDRISSELTDVLGVLATSGPTSDLRHRTLRAAIDWSYELLDSHERDLFTRLSIFEGGFDVDAAHAVAGNPSSDLATTRDLISRLVDKSLVMARTQPVESRFTLLSTIRGYAREKLAGAEAEYSTAARHAAYYVELAEGAERTREEGKQDVWLQTLDVDGGNVSAAIDWTLTAEPRLAVRLTAAVWPYSAWRGHYFDGRAWLDAALEMPGVEGEPAYPELLLGAGTLAFLCCDYQTAADPLDRALAIFDAAGDTRGRARTLHRLATVARELGRYDEARRLHERSLQLWRRLADQSQEAHARTYSSFVAWLSGDLEFAEQEAKAALSYFRQSGDSEGVVWSLINLGAVARERGSYAVAEPLLMESRAISEQLGFPEGVAWSDDQLGRAERARGRYQRATTFLTRSFGIHRDLGDRWRAASVLAELAVTAAMRHRTRPAVFLHAAAAQLRDEIGVPIPGCERADVETSLASARLLLGDAAFEQEWSAGWGSWWTALPDSGGLDTGPVAPAD